VKSIQLILIDTLKLCSLVLPTKVLDDMGDIEVFKVSFGDELEIPELKTDLSLLTDDEESEFKRMQKKCQYYDRK